MPFALANLASFPEHRLLPAARLDGWSFSSGWARLYQMPEIQPFALRLRGPGFGGSWLLSARGLSSGAYGEMYSAVGYSRKILRQLHAGLELSIFQISIDDYGTAWAQQVNLRAYWQIQPDLALAFRWFNVNQADFGQNHYELPRRIALGGSYQPIEHLRLFLELEKDTRYPLQSRLGAQVHLYKPFWLLLGFQSEPRIAAAGCSFLWRSLQAAAAFQYHHDLGMSQCYGLSITF